MILVTGANGFIGNHVNHTLLKMGYKTKTSVRNNLAQSDRNHHATQPCFVGNISGRTDWKKILVDVTTIVHCAALVHVSSGSSESSTAQYQEVNIDGTLNLAQQAAQQGVERFIFLSSVGVNGKCSSKAFSELDKPSPHNEYAESKYYAESGLFEMSRKNGMEIVVIRPPLVYGPGVKGSFASLLYWVRKGIPLPLGAIHNQRSFLALENLVDFIVLCADRQRSPGAANHIFLLSDGEDISTTDLLRKVAQAYHVQARLIPVPVTWLRLAARLFGKDVIAERLLDSLVIDCSKARRLLGWRPVVSMVEQLEKMANNDKAA